jgi:hypothetical protein
LGPLRTGALAGDFQRLAGVEKDSMEGSSRKAKLGVSKRPRGRAERPSSGWPCSANPRVGRNRRSPIHEPLKEREADEIPLAGSRDEPVSPLSGGVPRALGVYRGIRRLHSQQPSRGVLKCVVVGLPWRRDAGDSLGINPAFRETECSEVELLITNPRWPLMNVLHEGSRLRCRTAEAGCRARRRGGKRLTRGRPLGHGVARPLRGRARRSMRSLVTIASTLRSRFFLISELYGNEISLMVEVETLILLTPPSM